MNVAIVGSSGYIAKFLIRRLRKESMVEKILTIGRKTEADIYLDLLEPEKFDYRNLDNIDYVVFTAAVSSPDKCAEEFELSWNINVIGTKYFIKNAIARKCKVLFFSSDAVFGDDSLDIYIEESPTFAVTPYGRMKKEVEDEFKNCLYFKAIRLSYVVSSKDRFVSYCVSCMRNNVVAEIFHPFYRNCTVINDVSNIVIWFSQHWDQYKPFALNVAGKELVSRVRIADELNRHFDTKLRYTIVNPGEQFYLNRPQITQMKSIYMDKYHIVEELSFTEKLGMELEELEI